MLSGTKKGDKSGRVSAARGDSNNSSSSTVSFSCTVFGEDALPDLRNVYAVGHVLGRGTRFGGGRRGWAVHIVPLSVCGGPWWLAPAGPPQHRPWAVLAVAADVGFGVGVGGGLQAERTAPWRGWAEVHNARLLCAPCVSSDTPPPPHLPTSPTDNPQTPGSYGTVYAGTRHADGAPVAIKSIDKARLAKSAVFLQDTRREGEILKLVGSHPAITRLVDIAEDAYAVHFVKERCGEELFDKIVTAGSFSEADAARTFESMLRALDHLHQLGIAHRDVKPENFLLGGHEEDSLASRVRLCDFGIATYALPGTELTELVGSAPYVAPEVVLRSYSLSADVWSLGVVLYVMLSGLPAFWSTSGADGEIFAQILDGDIDLESPPWPSISADAKDLVARLLTRDPARRPSAADALRHPWLLAQGASERPLDAVVPRRLARFAGMSRLRRAALISAAGALPSTDTAALRALFDSLDTDHTGSLSADELRVGVARLTDGCADEDALEAAVSAVTRSARGEGLSFGAFVAATHTAASLTRQSCMASAFDTWDSNHDGSLTLEDVKTALESAGVPSDDVGPLFAAADVDGDGRLQLTEFCNMATAALEAEPMDDDCRLIVTKGAQERADAAARRLYIERMSYT